MSKKSIKSDLTRLDAMRDEDIDYSDIPELDERFFEKATVRWPTHKRQLTKPTRTTPPSPDLRRSRRGDAAGYPPAEPIFKDFR